MADSENPQKEVVEAKKEAEKEGKKPRGKKGGGGGGGGKKEEEEKITFSAKKEDFSEWFDQIIGAAEIMDRRYPVKGMPVFCPYGFAIHNKMMQILEAEWERLEIEKAQFPLLIPREFFELEGEFAKGFEEEVFWVTMGGLKPLDIQLAMRPTSETPMYYMFSQWIRTYRDLPLKVHQTCSVFRHETKQTRPLIRAREIHWNEAHTCYATQEGALQDLENAWGAYYHLIHDCALFTGLRLRRPDWDKFPGGEHTDVLDTIMPSGRVLQTVGAHYLGQKFAKSFKIQFLNEKQKHENVFMTCYGVSTRLTAAALGIHGDDKGLILPPMLARWQVLIVPIIFKKNDDRTAKKAQEIRQILQENGVRAFLDDSKKKPGDKYYYWEMKGVPLRIEVGNRDLENEVVTVVPRNTGVKATIPLASETIAESVKKELTQIADQMRAKAFAFNEERVVTCETKEALISALEKGCVGRIPYYSMGLDGKKGDEIVHEWTGGEVRGSKVGEEAPPQGTLCLVTGEPAKVWGYVARCY